MATLEEQIATKFLAKLAEADEVDPAIVQKLRELLAKKAKIKPDELVRILSMTEKEEIS